MAGIQEAAMLLMNALMESSRVGKRLDYIGISNDASESSHSVTMIQSYYISRVDG